MGGGERIRGLRHPQPAEEGLASSRVSPRGLQEAAPAPRAVHGGGGLVAAGTEGLCGEQRRLSEPGGGVGVEEGDWTREQGSDAGNG